MNRQQATAKSRCSKGLRLRAVFCFAILLFADLEGAAFDVIIAGPTSGPLHPLTKYGERYSKHASKHSQQLSLHLMMVVMLPVASKLSVLRLQPSWATSVHHLSQHDP